MKGTISESNPSNWIYEVTGQFKTAYSNLNTKKSDWINNNEEGADYTYKANLGAATWTAGIHGRMGHAVDHTGPGLAPTFSYTSIDGTYTIDASAPIRASLRVNDENGNATEVRLKLELEHTLQIEYWEQKDPTIPTAIYNQIYSDDYGNGTTPVNSHDWDGAFAGVAGRWSADGLPAGWNNGGAAGTYSTLLSNAKTRLNTDKSTQPANRRWNAAAVTDLWIRNAALYVNSVANLPAKWTASLPITVTYE